MIFDKVKFEKKYLGNKVMITLKEQFLVDKGRWLNPTSPFKGHLRKLGNNYYIEEEYERLDSVLCGYCFSLFRIEDIKIIK